jgi:3-oxoacyl-[acyl-carrier protein] reductase
MNGKVAVVTGGTKGIGRGIAEALVRDGLNVAICARKEQDVTRAVNELNELAEGKAIGTVCDVRDDDQVAALFKWVAAELGGVDILVNNAGVGAFGPVETMTAEEFRSVIETNLNGVFYCCRAVIPLMKRSGGGYIINISS